MQSSIAQDIVAKKYREACMAELGALKPGNVHIFADGHGMVVEDFLKSADVSMVPISKLDFCVGERIFQSVSATWDAVSCNTNLGIVLLAAPLIQAVFLHHELSQSALKQTLQQLTIEDAKFAFQAIQLASPAGLGEVAEHDVQNNPQVTLLKAMQAAANRDLIAQQYANGFAEVFAGVKRYLEYLAKWERPAWAVTAVYLGFLATFEDSHIARKYGQDKAKDIQQQAQQHYAAYTKLENPKLYQASLLSWDQTLKNRELTQALALI